MASNLPDLEQRLSNLQWQLERLSQKNEENVQPPDQRLTAMADQYAEHLKRWVVTAERHALAVAQLESFVSEWNDVSNRAHQDASHRLQELEAIIQREWDSLKTLHEEPVKELREQAASLTEVCIAAASVAQQGFDRTEARLASFEGEFHRLLGELTREVQSAVALMKGSIEHQPALDTASQWSLDEVTRLHSRLRDGREVVSPAGTAVQAVQRPAVSGVRELPPAIAAELEELRRVRRRSTGDTETVAGRIISDAQPVGERAIPWMWRIGAICAGLAVIAAGSFGWYLQSQVQAALGHAQEAEIQSQRAAADAERQVSAARDQAALEIASAREIANRAQRIGNVLAAPDLVRYNLASPAGASGASGQALWSRSRGFVLSGSRIPPPPPGGAHQIWLLTRVAPVKGGTFSPEPDGTATIIQEPPNVPRAVIGVMVTAEPAAAGDSPSGEPILTSVLPAP